MPGMSPSSTPFLGFASTKSGASELCPAGWTSTVPGPMTLEITPPPGGALVRVLTIAPVALADWAPNLHGDNDRHVLLLVSGTVELILEDTEVTMAVGDSVVLSGHVHDWRNTSGEPAVLVYTTFTLTASDSAI